MEQSQVMLGLCLSDENVKLMQRFCDSIDFLKQASQSGAEVHMDWPEANPTPAPSAPASAVQTTATAPATPAPSPAPVTAAPTAPAAPIVTAPAAVNPTPATFTPAIPQTAPVAAQAPTAAPSYTMDQIAKAGAELAQSGKMPQLLSLLQQYQVQAITQLPKEQYGAFAMALRGLGAQL